MLEKLQSALDAVNTKRSQIVDIGWYLQHCWLVQVKPGGNARTERKYWQVRSRQPMFEGKTLKHLKSDEVEDYRAAIARGRQLKQIDRQIAKLQQQLERLIATTDQERQTAEGAGTGNQHPLPSPQTKVTFTDAEEQERLVQEVLAKSQQLRTSLNKSAALNQRLRAGSINLRNGHPHLQ